MFLATLIRISLSAVDLISTYPDQAASRHGATRPPR